MVLDVVLEGDRGGLLHSEVEALRQQNIDERGSVPGVSARCLEKRLRLLPGSLIRPRSRRSAEKRKRENEVRARSHRARARERERERPRGREGGEGTYRKVGLRLRERRHELLVRHDNQPHTKPWRTSALADPALAALATATIWFSSFFKFQVFQVSSFFQFSQAKIQALNFSEGWVPHVILVLGDE